MLVLVHTENSRFDPIPQQKLMNNTDIRKALSERLGAGTQFPLSISQTTH